MAVSNGLFDFGANNITIAALNFVNQANNTVLYNPATGVAGAGVFGTGTLRVTGEINVLGVNDGNFNTNSIGNNLDLGGGTQIVRIGLEWQLHDFRVASIHRRSLERLAPQDLRLSGEWHHGATRRHRLVWQ